MMRIAKYLIVILILQLMSCSKFLEEKPASTITTPQTEDDIKMMLNYTTIMHRNEPGIMEIAADDYFLTDQAWNSITLENDRLAYVWSDQPMILSQWSGAYTPIMYSNVILESLDKIKYKDLGNRNRFDGIARFHRAINYYRILQAYAVAFDPASAAVKLGFALRESADIETKSRRLTIQQSYAYLIDDLSRSTNGLRVTEEQSVYPNKSAAFSILANLYLDMMDYENAYKMADSSIFYNQNELLDFNKDLKETDAIPFVRTNKEIIFYSLLNGSQALVPSRARVAKELLSLYEPFDLRLSLFYHKGSDGNYSFKGNYDGNNTSGLMFSGITVGELLLQRAEAAARTRRNDIALQDLNLLSFRIKKAEYVPYERLESQQLLDEILKERRKELVYRGRRWSDLKRFAVEGRTIPDLSRTINGEAHTLTPIKLKLFAFKIPDLVIENSDIEQN
ncbi:RagB/SusD family nutrient uptake outer membrane protein [Sphingobacterium siyangense]|uniref:RagB/SusD family nutrient uptake outer membrane protein n=1 Tax=Sphingobacterium siyangense TaxID=459529 RepID=UPI003DA6B43D